MYKDIYDNNIHINIRARMTRYTYKETKTSGNVYSVVVIIEIKNVKEITIDCSKTYV